MADAPVRSRSIAEEIGEDIVGSVQTPTELFFMTLFVIGVLSIASTTLVGECGRVDDAAEYPDARSVSLVPGAVVFTTSAVVFGEFVVEPGVCGIVERVDDERDTAEVHILAKAQPGFLQGPDGYRPTLALSEALSHPLSTLFFLHNDPPSGVVPFHQLGVIPTQTYTNWFRHFYLSGLYLVMALLAVFVGLFGYIGFRFERKRVVWYERHSLRTRYRARLMHDRSRTRALLLSWEQYVFLSTQEDPARWREALIGLDELLEDTLVLLQFGGENLTDRLQKMTKEDLWCIEQLWDAHSLIIRMQGQVEPDEPIPPITEKAVQHVFALYKEAFIWLGLLEHHA